MAQQDRLSDQERADLVAYLDGELHGAAARALEAKLLRSPQVRAEAESLKRTWELLDCLPRAEPSPRFTERTLSRLAPATGSIRRPDRVRTWPSGVRACAWAAGVLLAFAAGWVGYGRLVMIEPSDRELVRDLRLIENKTLYESVGDLEFLRQLDRPDLFGDERPGS